MPLSLFMGLHCPDHSNLTASAIAEISTLASNRSAGTWIAFISPFPFPLSPFLFPIFLFPVSQVLFPITHYITKWLLLMFDSGLTPDSIIPAKGEEPKILYLFLIKFTHRHLYRSLFWVAVFRRWRSPHCMYHLSHAYFFVCTLCLFLVIFSFGLDNVSDKLTDIGDAPNIVESRKLFLNLFTNISLL